METNRPTSEATVQASAMQNFPFILTNTGKLTSCEAFGAFLIERQSAIETQLNHVGAALLRGFPVKCAEEFDAATCTFGYPTFTYEESLSNAVRVNLTPRVFTANEAPPDVEIFLHHEMAQTPLAPTTLFFFCQTPASDGGQTPLCRSDLLFEQLEREHPQWARALEEKGLKYSTSMPGFDDPKSGQGRSWRSTLSVENRDMAETQLRRLGYQWQWLNDDSLRATTPVLPGVRTLADGRKTLFNQLIAAYLGWAGVKQNPSSALTFGDGSPIGVNLLEYIAETSPAFTVDLAWQAGDIAIVNNHLVMHGRRPYSGKAKRLVLVSLAA